MAIKEKRNTTLAIASGLSLIKAVISLDKSESGDGAIDASAKFNYAKSRLTNNLLKKKDAK